MVLDAFKGELKRFHAGLSAVCAQPVEQGSGLHDFRGQKAAYVQKSVAQSLSSLRQTAFKLQQASFDDPDSSAIVQRILNLVPQVHIESASLRIVDEIEELVAQLPQERTMKTMSSGFSSIKIPAEIHDEVKADVAELENCFQAGCYRSATILSGRLLEVALHRKYFEMTGQDILETNPGMGLGKLIAKLTELKVSFDPGLTQQIHLINQARISSVHKKQEVFHPTKNQAQAIILYTIDALQKLFGELK